MDKEKALEILKSDSNIFLTGAAGTGKTFLLNEFIEYLKEKEIRFGVTASTGVAATHLNGITLHSWAGMGIDEKKETKKKVSSILRKPGLIEKIKETKILIIDEISMLKYHNLDLLDNICKIARSSLLPFGGMRVIMCGDFFQLPPVNQENKEYLFAYNALVWRNSDIKVCYLEKQYRQEDPEFIKILNAIRENKTNSNILEKLKTRINQSIVINIDKPTRIFAHNSKADSTNNYELSKIIGEEHQYDMTSWGPDKLVKILKKNCLAPECLILKIGAIVMFVRNNFGGGYVNGTLGKVIDFNEGGYPIIETVSNKITVIPQSWNIEENNNILAKITQFPLKLAWAITIHKSQGMTLDAAEIDLGSAFEYGMGYVALSRLKSLNSLKLIGINELSLKVNPNIIKKDIEFKQLSKDLEKIISQ